MEIITNTLRDFFNAESQLWQSTIIALILLSILAIVLLIGWKVNNKNPKVNITFKNANENVLFMIKRALSEE